MSKIRLLILLFTFFIVGTVGTLVSLYARGYRLNSENYKLNPNGLLVVKSVPDGAQLFINGTLNTATNATVPLPPGTYDVRIRKEGYLDWNKRLTIEKEIVTDSTAHLFKSTPSLSALTFSGVTNPTPSRDFTKIAYVVPPNLNSENSGLWIFETINLPLGFARDPKRITDGDLTKATWIWSPDGRQILMTTSIGMYLVDTTAFTAQAKLINVFSQKDTILAEWDLEKQKLIGSQTAKLPIQMQDVMSRKASAIRFSPDEDMILYTASSSGDVPSKLIPQLPGSSTQKETRQIEIGKTYVYDIKEDRNFLVDEDNILIEGGYSDGFERRLSWYPSSRTLILSEKDKVVIMDYDGTNKQVVYSGSYVSPNAFPTTSLDRLLILTNLGAAVGIPNLYSLSLK
jgi:hypothetical protein